ncbi:MAG TPA: FAD-dependent oxidoreductase [Ensifer sp.]|nr:FAD-dependent oxidoreductase [Ensifer sp.]
MSIAKRLVIVGAGQAGFQAAASLRQEGFEGSILMIGDEPALPYQRPPLSKTYLKEGDPARLELRPRSFYERLGIDLAMPNVAVDVNRADRVVRTEDGARYPFDYLILATGSACVSPPIPGAALPGVHQLRTLSDAERLRHSLETARRVVVIGGGFIGLEFASVALQAGHEVTLIETAPRLMARALSAHMSETFGKYHMGCGLRLKLSESVLRITADQRGVYSIVLEHECVEADLVLLATGVRPNVLLAVSAGLEIDNGVRATETLQTSDPAIFALGDCASFPDPFTLQRVRLESVQAATDQARLIAKNIVSDMAAPYAALPWFWSDQGQYKLQIAGLSLPGDDEAAVERGDGSLSVFRFRSDRFVALETVNGPSDHMAARKILQARVPVSRQELQRTDFDVKSLARAMTSASN